MSTAFACVTAVVTVFIVPFKSPEKVVAVTVADMSALPSILTLPVVCKTPPVAADVPPICSAGIKESACDDSSVFLTPESYK